MHGRNIGSGHGPVGPFGGGVGRYVQGGQVGKNNHVNVVVSCIGGILQFRSRRGGGRVHVHGTTIIVRRLGTCGVHGVGSQRETPFV